MRLLLAAAPVIAAGLLALPMEAAALDPVIEENMPAITEHIARGGATSVPGVDCGARCAEWWVEEHRPIPGRQSSAALHRELRTVRVTTKVLPRLRTLGRLGLKAGAPGTAAYVGWQIGTGIRTKLLKIGVPEPVDSTVTDQALNFQQTWTGQEAWVWNYRQYSQTWDRWHGDYPACPGVEPPARMSTLSRTEAWCVAGATVNQSYLAEDALSAPSPVEDYTDQPFEVATADWPDKPTGQPEAPARAHDGLTNAPFTEAWYCSLLKTQECETPQLESSREQCELSNALNGDPAGMFGTGGEGSPDYLLRYLVVPAPAYASPGSAWPETGFQAVGTPNGEKVFMRYGFTYPHGNPKMAWGGWGYRHIAAKHGWTVADKLATEEALLRPPEVRQVPDEDAFIDRYVYTGREYTGRNNARCVRRVVVDYERRQAELRTGQPAASMITSYGREL